MEPFQFLLDLPNMILKKNVPEFRLWTAINVFIILIVSFFIGQYVLTFFGISIDALRIAGGIIIVNSGFSLLSGKFNKKRGINKKIETDAQQRNDIALTPLSNSNACWPGSISLLIAFYQEHHAMKEIIISSFSYFSYCSCHFCNFKKRALFSQNIRSIRNCCNFQNCWFYCNFNRNSIYRKFNHQYCKRKFDVNHSILQLNKKGIKLKFLSLFIFFKLLLISWQKTSAIMQLALPPPQASIVSKLELKISA